MSIYNWFYYLPPSKSEFTLFHNAIERERENTRKWWQEFIPQSHLTMKQSKIVFDTNFIWKYTMKYQL